MNNIETSKQNKNDNFMQCRNIESIIKKIISMPEYTSVCPIILKNTAYPLVETDSNPKVYHCNLISPLINVCQRKV